MANQPDRLLGQNQALLETLQNLLPGVTFEQGESFVWSPGESTVTYFHKADSGSSSTWALLHEAGHAILEHKSYEDDIDLLKKEVAAWDKAKEIAQEHQIRIDEDHVEDCLDTYRDWLHQRSTCPRCGTVSLQTSSKTYHCYNCFAGWKVSTSRFCRPYRLSKDTNKKPPEISQTAD